MRQAVRTVPVNERLPIYDVYLKRASDFFGIGKVGSGNPVGTATRGVRPCMHYGAGWHTLLCLAAPS